MRDLILLGASGLAREAAAAEQDDYRVIGVLDDDASLHRKLVSGVEVLGNISLATEYDAALLICVGSGASRRRIFERLAALGVGWERYATLIAAETRLPTGCSIGTGSLVLAGCVLTADVAVGRHVVVMPNCTITHDDVVDDYVTIAAGVSLGGAVHLGEACYVGMNASIRQNLAIGAGAVIGMAAAVLNDVPPGETWAGVPAAPIRQQVSK